MMPRSSKACLGDKGKSKSVHIAQSSCRVTAEAEGVSRTREKNAAKVLLCVLYMSTIFTWFPSVAEDTAAELHRALVASVGRIRLRTHTAYSEADRGWEAVACHPSTWQLLA